MPNLQYEICIKACEDCLVACEECASECLREEGGNLMAPCIQLDCDCALICDVAVKLLSRQSLFSTTICLTCAEICRACSAECRKHDMKHCQDCANACDICADECEAISNVPA